MNTWLFLSLDSVYAFVDVHIWYYGGLALIIMICHDHKVILSDVDDL